MGRERTVGGIVKYLMVALLLFSYGCSSTHFAPKLPEGQYLPGQITNSDFHKDRFKEKLENSPHISNGKIKLPKHYHEKENQVGTPMLPASVKRVEYKKENMLKTRDGIDLQESGQRILGEYSKGNKFLEFKNEDMVDDFKYAGRDAFSFSLLKDSFDYKSKNNTYEKVYEDKDNAETPLTIHFSFDHYFSRGYFDLALGLNTGVGYHRGPAIFSENQITVPDVKFTLWTIPLEPSLTFELAMSNWIKLSVSGGPSALGIIQSRSDRDYGDVKKSRRQIGYGYFVSGKFKIGLTPLSKSSAVEMYSSSGITGTYIYVVARTVSYSGFKNEDLTISGQSIGVGFSFEYL